MEMFEMRRSVPRSSRSQSMLKCGMPHEKGNKRFFQGSYALHCLTAVIWIFFRTVAIGFTFHFSSAILLIYNNVD